MPTPTPEPVVHVPTIPTEEDIERLSALFGRATGELQGVTFRLRAYTSPYFADAEEPETARPTFEDMGRLYQLIAYAKLDRWVIDTEIRELEQQLENLVTLRDEGGDDA